MSVTLADSTGLRTILRALAPVRSRFASAGHELYLVGGVVRDLLLGLPLQGDIDLTTGARPEVTLAIISELTQSIWSQGQRFGTIGARIDGHDLEITTFRSESYDEHSRKPIVAFGDDLHTDLSRRDFTINAMAVSVDDGRLIDPFGGAGDLESGVLRTPIDPDTSFGDDPLRLLRAARFLARFDMMATPELSRAATANAERMNIVSVERIHNEFEHLLAAERPLVGLRFLADHALLARIIPAPHTASVEDPAIHRAAADSERSPDARSLVRRAGFFFDLGSSGARHRLTALRYPRIDVEATATVIALAPRLSEPAPTAAELRHVAFDAGPTGEPALVDAACELAALIGPPSAAATCRAALHQLRSQEDLSRFDPPIDGSTIIELLGLEPGPAIGRVLDALRRHRLEHGPFDTDEAIDLLPELAARLGLPLRAR